MTSLPLDQIRPQGDGFSLEFSLDPKERAFAGHFPEEPLLPGAAVLACMHEALQASGALPGASGEVFRAKFLAPIRPDDVVTFEWNPIPKGWRIIARVGETMAATAEFHP
jgi:3-hydroxymyristoyl/3-hydroxydecanoyl-(acyl carrier protein) dehydratase